MEPHCAVLSLGQTGNPGTGVVVTPLFPFYWLLLLVPLVFLAPASDPDRVGV